MQCDGKNDLQTFIQFGMFVTYRRLLILSLSVGYTFSFTSFLKSVFISPL